MVRKRLLLLLKPLDVYPVRRSNGLSRFTNPRIIHHLDNRRKVHKDAIDFCQRILRQKSVDWEPVFRNNLTKSIHDVDLVVTVGGDGTLLQASHFMDDSVPVLGVNSDPTQIEEVGEIGSEFNATRSTGYLCAATIRNFEQVLDDVLEDRAFPSKLTRISICINSQRLSTYALNDILIAHPCPAAVSRLSFKIRGDRQPCSPLVNCRSSGLRVCTAAGSTAAMISAGGFAMPILSQDLQYMVREPISPGMRNSSLTHGLIKYNQYMDTTWFSEEGRIYIDGSHVFHAIQDEDSIEVSSKAPVLQVFLPDHLLL
ncbi:NADH kinase isoform X1 [Tripterygium wilfordii]|nr:NADH kinase isoform X1 [Tripterygium wilfordii]